jgi:hypothetical protein
MHKQNREEPAQQRNVKSARKGNPLRTESMCFEIPTAEYHNTGTVSPF